MFGEYENMPGKRLTVTQLTEAATLRTAGYTLTSIAERVGCSVSSLQRAFKRHKVKAGSLSEEAVKRAADDLLGHVTDSERVKVEAARLVADDLAHSRLIRERAATTLESLTASDTADAAITLRALAAYAVILKNTSDVVRRSMRLDRDGLYEDMELLPELPITAMTDDEVEKVRREAAGRLGMSEEELETMAEEDDAVVVIGGPDEKKEAAA